MLKDIPFVQHHPLLSVLLIVGGIFYWVISVMVTTSSKKFSTLGENAFGYPLYNSGNFEVVTKFVAFITYLLFVFPFIILPIYLLKIIPYGKIKNVIKEILIAPFMFIAIYVVAMLKGTWKAVRGL
jgi:hypothetical protein